MAQCSLCVHIHKQKLLLGRNSFHAVLYYVVDSSLHAVGLTFEEWDRKLLSFFCASNMVVELRFMSATSYKIRLYICFIAYQRYVKGFPKPPTMSYFWVVDFS